MNYLSAKQISIEYDYSLRTVRALISEIRSEVQRGRYPPISILDGCGTRVNEDVLVDFLAHRKMLKDATARKYVAEYKEETP